MEFKITKYCIMTLDLKQVEVGLSRQYHFEKLSDVIEEKCKSPIKLFNSFNTAKSAFQMSFRGYTYDEERQVFVDRSGKPEYLIKQIDVTYDLK